ncbi:uncharacterized protein LOC109494105 [Felis catus]|uniref:uncharacterized protein LOC109494105 n=1 Tax=Felis catus TaxID=9685 RepID=UPI001D19FFBD|nr:uncharacterized protein LOC109494105 [Felis catus]
MGTQDMFSKKHIRNWKSRLQLEVERHLSVTVDHKIKFRRGGLLMKTNENAWTLEGGSKGTAKRPKARDQERRNQNLCPSWTYTMLRDPELLSSRPQPGTLGAALRGSQLPECSVHKAASRLGGGRRAWMTASTRFQPPPSPWKDAIGRDTTCTTVHGRAHGGTQAKVSSGENVGVAGTWGAGRGQGHLGKALETRGLVHHSGHMCLARLQIDRHPCTRGWGPHPHTRGATTAQEPVVFTLSWDWTPCWRPKTGESPAFY